MKKNTDAYLKRILIQNQKTNMQKHSLSSEYSASRSIHLVILFLFLCGNVFSQQLTISGTVTDASTRESIPYVNIVFKNTTTGTTTDTLGYYKIKSPGNAHVLRFSAIGYYPEEKSVPSSGEIILSVRLKPETVDLSEVKVAPNEGPVRRLLKKINDHKSRNNPEQYKKYSYRKYTRWEYQINNVGDKIVNSRAFRNNKSVFKTAQDSSRYLPLYFSEQLVFNEIQKDPPKQKSTVIADKTNGVGILDKLQISGYTSALDMEVNFYDNFINLFTQNFISPIADNGWFYYKYFLADSMIVNGHKQYRVNFQPRRVGENTFKGYFITEDKYYSLVEIDGDLSTTSNINFMRSLRLKSNYAFVNDSMPFYKRNQIDALFDVIPFKTKKKDQQRLSIFFTQTTNVDQVTINPDSPIELTNPKAKYETINMPDASNRDSVFWKQNRMEELSQREHEIRHVIDTISQIGTVRTINNLAHMTMTSYYDLGRVEVGPFTSFFNTNKVEGMHLFFGGRTSEEISKNKMVWAGIGYGTRNKKVNGMFGFGYKFPTSDRQVIKLSYDDKMIRTGENEKILYLYENAFTSTENNLVSQMLKHDELDEIFRERKINTSYEHEWYPGLLNKLSASYTTHFSPEFYPFMRNGQPVSSVSAMEVSLDTRLSKEEKLVDDGFLRLYMSTKYPIFHFTIGGGRVIYDKQSNWYGRVASTIKQEIFLGQSRFDYAVESGIYLGKLPYTMLDIPRGNETYGYYSYDFNLLNYLEYVHDEYLHTYMEYHLNGFLFRRLPLLKKTNLREVISAKMMLGSLSDKNQKVIEFPGSITKMDNPYIEVGAGIENILKMFQVEAVWRVHPESVIGAPSFGIRAKFELIL